MNIKNIIRKILGKNFFYNNFYLIQRELESVNTVLDLGCGNNSPYKRYWLKPNHKSIGVDLYSNEFKSDNYKIVKSDVLEFLKAQPDKSFDSVLALDIIEHVEKSSALLLKKHMERVAKKNVIIVTPNGYWPGMSNAPGMKHLCGFTYKEFLNDGYKVFGSGGLAILRSRKHSYLKGMGNFKNTLPFQLIIFNLGNLFVKHRPKFSYGITAIKNIN